MESLIPEVEAGVEGKRVMAEDEMDSEDEREHEDKDS